MDSMAAVVKVWLMEEVSLALTVICYLNVLDVHTKVYQSEFVFSFSGSYGASDVGGMYSSSYGGDYMPRGSDVCF